MALVNPDFLSSDEDYSNECFSEEDSENEDVCRRIHPQLVKSSQANCAPVIEVPSKEKSERPMFPSWASEMSLYDMLSPRRSLGSIQFPSTPEAVPTPTEFKEINWKRFGEKDNHKNLKNTALNVRKNKSSNEVVDGEREDGEQQTKDEKAKHSHFRELKGEAYISGEVKPGRPALVGDVQSERVNTPSKISDQECSIVTGEPDFDHKNLIVNYLPPDMDSTMLRNLFSPYGTIVRCNVITDHITKLSKGYGFVKFHSVSEGIKAKNALHQFQIGRKTLKVSFSRQPHSGENTKQHTNLFLSNLDPKMTQEDLERHFKTCGYVVQCKVLKDTLGVSKQIGFVRFNNSESAQRAIDSFDGKQLEGSDRPIKIRIASSPRLPPERESPASHFSSSSSQSHPRSHITSTACYVAGFDVSVSEKALRKVFEPSGFRRVKSVRIIRRHKGPYAFVNFFNSKYAVEASNSLNNTSLGGAVLTVRLQT